MSEKYNSLFSIVVTAKMGHALQTRARGDIFHLFDIVYQKQSFLKNW